MYHWALALIVSIGLASLMTGPKLYRMARIVGWQPGAEVATRWVAHKGVDNDMRGRKFHWVSWAIDGSPTDRDNVSPEVWESMKVGDAVEVVFVPGTNEKAHLRKGVFVEEGNFVFDFILLGVEILVAVASFGRLLWWWIKGRKEPFWGPDED
jgi:hypothetical protein